MRKKNRTDGRKLQLSASLTISVAMTQLTTSWKKNQTRETSKQQSERAKRKESAARRDLTLRK